MKVKRAPAQGLKGGSPPLRLVERASTARPALASEPEIGAVESASSPNEPPNTSSGTRWAEASAGAQRPKAARSQALESLLALSDGRLVPLALSGDPLAQEALYRKHASFAIHLATRIEGSTRDVEDVVHDAFIKALTRLADLADPQAFRSWLGSIVVHAVRSRLRRARLMSMLGLSRGADPIEIDSVASCEASPHTRAQLAQIYALLRTLPTDERIAWTLRYVEGNELDIVARLTDCSLATVKRRISRAQKFLQEHFIDTDAPLRGDTDAPLRGDTDAPVRGDTGVGAPSAAGDESQPTTEPHDPIAKFR